MDPYLIKVIKENKGMDFTSNNEQWGSLANFILSDKSSSFYETLYKIKHPDARDRVSGLVFGRCAHGFSFFRFCIRLGAR